MSVRRWFSGFAALLMLSMSLPAFSQSMATSAYPIGACIQQLLGASEDVQAKNDRQSLFMREFLPSGNVSLSELKSLVSGDAGKLTAFLKAAGFKLEVPPMRPNQVGCASVLDLKLAWQIPGEVTKIPMDDAKKHSAAKFKGGFKAWDLRQTEWARHLFALQITDGSWVYILAYPKRPSNSTALLSLVPIIRADKLSSYSREGTSLTLPMIDFNGPGDLNQWLPGLKGAGGTIAWAGDEYELKLDETGVTAKAAAAMMATRGLSLEEKPDFMVLEPFIIWIERPGLAQPLFVAWIDYPDMKKP